MSSLSNFALPIGADLVRFVQDEVASGRYASAADVVETALQRMRETGTRETGTRETGTRGGECANGECTAAVGDLDACEELLGSILNASGLCAGIMELLDDDILYPVLNRKAAECHGMCGAGRAGARASEVGLTREEIDKWLVFLRDCLDRGKSVSAEYPYRAAAEVTGWFVGMFTPLPPGPTGRPRVSFICIDISERKETEELQMLLVNELNHRVKNTLATVQSIVSQTLRTNEVPETVRDTLDARLLALSAAHDVLTAQDWRTADVSEIVWSAVAPYRIDGVDRFTVGGPNLRIRPRTALALSMALHELCTNAVKYGALSGEAGRVEISWETTAPNFRMRWVERGGPPVCPPTRTGFGTRMIERGLAAEIRGEVRIAYPPGGVVCTVAAPLSVVVQDGPREAHV